MSKVLKHERRQPSQDRAIQKRQQILEGAKKILSENELSAFNMREVAKVSGVGLGTLYDYFPKKSSILYWLLSERLEGRFDILDRHVDNIIEGRSFEKAIKAYNDEMLAANMWSQLDITLLFSAEYEDESLVALRDEFHEQLADRYYNAYRKSGSDWPEEDLRSIARYLIHLDKLNLQLQRDAPPTQRHHYRNMTYAAFKSALEMTSKPCPT